MPWEFITDTLIRHRLGHEITLVSGTWKSPAEIAEVFHGQIPAGRKIKLLCEGLYFAEINPTPSSQEFLAVA